MAPPHEDNPPQLEIESQDEGKEKAAADAENTVEGESEVVLDDAELLKQARDQVAEECYLKAARLFEKVSDKSLLSDLDKHALSVAERCKEIKQELFEKFEDGGWHKQSEIHGHRDTCIYYKVNKDSSLLVRIETPIESSLLNPLLSVFSESDLYKDWMPSFKVPRLGVELSEKMQETGRGNQVIRVRIAMPFPFDNRECIQHAIAIDSIDEEDGCIVVTVKSLDEGKHLNGLDIPPPDRGVRRVDFEAGIVIRPCPADHPALLHSKNKYDGEKLLLVQVTQMMDAHVAGVPMSMINFFTRTVLGRMWGSLLQVAEDVRDGKRPAFAEKIAEHRELYDWVEGRVQVLLDKIHHH